MISILARIGTSAAVRSALVNSQQWPRYFSTHAVTLVSRTYDLARPSTSVKPAKVLSAGANPFSKTGAFNRSATQGDGVKCPHGLLRRRTNEVGDCVMECRFFGHFADTQKGRTSSISDNQIM